MSLELLPTELQCYIIRLLDPISFISISQANAHFRRLINPKQKHFAERLLALELVPEYGGPYLFFRSRDTSLRPDWTDPAWEKMRWACTNCLRLLSHKHFDNHSILRLRYRKPLPGSPAARMVTTWEQTRHIPHRNTNTEQAELDAKVSLWEAQKQRFRYFICVTSGKGHLSGDFPINNLDLLQYYDMEGFKGINQDQLDKMTQQDRINLLDQNALAVEGENCGKKRWLRKCNECRFQQDEIWQLFDETGGTRRLPIVPSRQVVFGSRVDRYFPGVSEYLNHKRPLFNAPLGLFHRKGAREQHWSMWMVRCPGCARWQELREFRFGGTHHHWKPARRGPNREGDITWDEKEITEPLLNTYRCNSCFAKTHGRQELGKVLSDWLLCLIGHELRNLSWQLSSGLHDLQTLTGQHLPWKYSNEWSCSMQNTPCLQQDFNYILKSNDITMLKFRREKCRYIWERIQIKDDEWVPEDIDALYDDLGRIFDECEEHWKWLQGCKREIEEQLEPLVEWALSRDGALFT
ncbi:hypothetical protein IWW34DRAFT_767766 [Fusarium oxysporum f. sp. albedinis]|nr:hypothetical protein IWW34DRAFT_767766 [Fusarium oxysporum f. sp. albedinis]KAK2469275.1 hypothetical protein H9L39_18992 [Fusarium oxysporum f. sp. albedinis]